MKERLLADIGNTHMHILDQGKILHLKHDEAIDQYKDRELCYISVSHRLDQKIAEIKNDGGG